MHSSTLRAAIIGLLCLVLGLAAGCSALRIGYNQAPDLAYWWLDGYADFDDAQSRRVRAAVSDWFAWHRRTQLPDYARLLSRMQSELLLERTPEQVCGWWAAIGERIDASVQHAVPAAAEVMLELGPAQIAHIEQRYAKKNDEFRADFLQSDPKERQRQSVKRWVERAESFYGRLDEAQRERVSRALAASPFDPERWMAERLRRQQDALEMLRRLRAERAGRDEAQAALRTLAARWQRSPREDYRRYSQALVEFNCTLVAALHNSTSAAQRQTAANRLKGWEGDARALAADATSQP